MKTLLIDDHPLILSALRTVIRGICADADLVGVETAQDARDVLVADSTFDLVLLDLQLGDFDGFELLVELRTTCPSLPVVVVSASDRSADIFRAIELGAMGFVPKRASNELLFDALNMVMSGNIYVPPMSLRSVATGKGHGDGERAWDSRPNFGGAEGCAAKNLSSFGFTPRQTEVLALLLRGQSNKLIAREMNLSVETIKDHVAAVMRTLKVNTRTQAVLAVSQLSNQPALSIPREGPRSETRAG